MAKRGIPAGARDALQQSAGRIMRQCEEAATLVARLHGLSSADDLARLQRLAVTLLLKIFYSYNEKLTPKLERFLATNPNAELLDLVRETIGIDAEHLLRGRGLGKSGPEFGAKWNLLVQETMAAVRKVLLDTNVTDSSQINANYFRIFGRDFS